MIFLHGWPELGIVWRAQLAHFSARGWRCIAPDMRGYGASSVQRRVKDYAVREVVGDMVELHDALGGAPAVWVGHDHGGMIAWAIAMHHADRCRGVVSLTVPHFARGIGLETLLPFVDRLIYPVADFPFGQWDYMRFYAEHFTRAVRDFETHLETALQVLYAPTSAKGVGKPAPLARIRAQGGWFPTHSAALPPHASLLPTEDRHAMTRAFARNGFSGPCAWYLNDSANIAFAAEAPQLGRIALPSLFVHAAWDQVCDTACSHLADPMREDCTDLTEVSIAGGHMLMLERSAEVNDAIDRWLLARGLTA